MVEMKKFILVFSIALFFLFPRTSFAEVIRSFDTNIIAHKNGLMDFTEVINYDFESLSRHGIFRNIPLYSKVGDLYRITKIENIKVLRNGKNEQFKTTYSTEQVSIKIGDPNKEITGAHAYIISYTVKNGIGSNFEDHDEIYWNITGNEWEVNIEKATATISTDFDTKLTSLICFEGPIGSKDETCEILGNTVTNSQILYPGYGLTVVAVYPPKTFSASILSKTPPQSFADRIFEFILKYYYLIWLSLNVLLPAALIYWYRQNKNKKKYGSPAVNFNTPEDEKGQRITPALSGTIDTAVLERDDITATIFDLAIRKYLRIEEKRTSRSLLPDSKDQIVIKLKEPDSKLLPYEKTLMERLFKNGESVKVSDLKKDFYATFSKMEKEVFENLVERGYYTKNPKTQKAFLLVFSAWALFTANIILAAVLFFLSLKLNGRTPKGDEADFKIDGLKLFLKSMDRNYKWQAEKIYTVEQMIPYAMALGYIDKFMEALKILKPDYKPDWYSGSGNFYTNYAVFSSVASSNFTTSAPSSSSGFSGGSSGGGGGGGGGGSW